MAEAIVDNLISQATIDSFPQLTKNVEDSVTALEKLLATGQKLAEKLNAVKVISDYVKVTDALAQSQADLEAQSKKTADAQAKLAELQRQATELANKQRQANIDNAKSVNEAARATAQQSSDQIDLTRALVNVKLGLQAVTAERKRLKEAAESNTISEEAYKQALTELLITETALKNTSVELTAATKNVDKVMSSAEGSINNLEASLKLAQQAYKALSDQEKVSEVGVATQQKIRTLSDEVNRQKKSIGDFSSNVGRYAESLGGLFDEVAVEIKNLKAQQDGTIAKFNQLTQAEQRTSVGFKLGGQIQAFANNIEQLERIQAIGENTNLSYTQSIKGLQKEFINVATAGTQSRTFIEGFKASLGEAVDKQNDLRAEIKLAASDTKTFDLLKSGVTGLVSAYQTGIGVISLFGDANEESEKTIKKLVAVQSVANGIQEIGRQLTEHNTLAYKGLAYAQNLYGKATDASATATQRLGASLKLIGIGLLIAAVAYLIINFDKLTGTASRTARSIDSLEGVSVGTKKALKEMGDTAEEIAESSIKELEDALKGLNDELGLSPTLVEKAQGALKLLNKEIADNSDEVSKASSFWNFFFNGINATSGLVGATNKQKKLNDELKIQSNLLTELIGKQAFIDQNRLNAERSKNATQILKDAQDINNRLLSLQRIGLNERLALTASTYDLEKTIIDRVHEDELTAAGKDEAKKFAADAKFNHDKIIAERNFQDLQAKIKKEYAERDFKATQDITERELQTQIDVDNRKAEHAKLLPDIQILALRGALRDQLALLEQQQVKELHVEGQTETEKENIHDKYNKLRIKAEQDTADKIQLIHTETVEEELNLYEKLTTRIVDQLSKIVDFQQKSKSINNETFNDFAKSVQDGLDNLDKLKFKGDPFAGALAGLLKFKGNIADTKEVDKFIESIKELEKNIKTLLDTGVDLAFSLQIDGLEKQKNVIQDQINLIDERRDKDIAAINASTKSEEDKANAIAVINATADAKKREAERKQKELDRKKAQIEKQQSIARLVQSTAEAVLAALGEKPYKPTNIANAAVVGAIGLANIAKVIAQPVPSYDIGTMDHPGGVALVHPGELIVTDKGKLVETPAIPTVLNLPEHAIVYPDAQRALAEYYGGMTVQKFNSIGNSNLEIVSGLRRIEKAVKNKSETHFHERSNGWEKIINTGGNTQRWIKQNIS